jgi:predicted lipase
MAWILASMAQLAYDRFEDARDLKKIRKIFVTKLESGGFKLIRTFYSPETDTQGFLAKNDEFAVLAFRGTEVSKRTDLKIDIQASKVSVLEGRVHSGFRVAYDSVAKDVEKAVLSLNDALPLYITGHSLGAALATVATQRLEHNPRIREIIAACYTFGSPRVGNSHYDLEFKSPIYRVVNTTDVVTVIPLLAMGYMHIGDVRYLGATEGEFQRGIPSLRRSYLFLLTLFKFFSPLVHDHSIAEYRRKLEAIAEKRNPRFGH